MEGDSAVIIRGAAVFIRLEETIHDEPNLPKVNNIIDKALGLILK